MTEAVQILRVRDKLGANYARLFEKAFNEFEEQKRRVKEDNFSTTIFSATLPLTNSAEPTVIAVAKAAAAANCGPSTTCSNVTPILNGTIIPTQQQNLPSQSSSASSSNSTLILSNVIKVC